MKITRYTRDPKVTHNLGCKDLTDDQNEVIGNTSGLCDEMEDTANAILFAFAGRMWEFLNGTNRLHDRDKLIALINEDYQRHMIGKE